MAAVRDFDGREIRLTEERWRHISEHPEMTLMRQAVEETLLGPEIVVQSLSDPEVRLYYRFFDESAVGPKYMCAVVKVVANDAFLITAYLTDRTKGGQVLWPRKR
jgi:hypothetical protein